MTDERVSPLADAGHLEHLMTELDANEGYAIGTTRFPGSVSDADAAEIAEAFANEVDVGTARRAELAEASGHHIYCKAGCNDCCTVLVMVYRPEAIRIAQFLEQPENAAARGAFL